MSTSMHDGTYNVYCKAILGEQSNLIQYCYHKLSLGDDEQKKDLIFLNSHKFVAELYKGQNGGDRTRWQIRSFLPLTL
jgi:hypothetical protein